MWIYLWLLALLTAIAPAGAAIAIVAGKDGYRTVAVVRHVTTLPLASTSPAIRAATVCGRRHGVASGEKGGPGRRFLLQASALGTPTFKVRQGQGQWRGVMLRHVLNPDTRTDMLMMSLMSRRD